MIKTYLKLAYRSLVKNKIFAFINISGLAIGLTCCFLISMYIIHELSYDTHQPLGNRLYQIGTYFTIEGKEERFANTPARMAQAMQLEFPEIENTTRLVRLFQDDKTLLQYKGNKNILSLYETNGYLADSTFFRLFSYSFKEGSPNSALDNPNSVVISQEVAKKIFGEKPALNKIIHVNSNTNGEGDFKVTGVFVPSKSPSHLDARFIMSVKGGEFWEWMQGLTDMMNNNLFYTYLLLKPQTDAKKLEAKFEAFIDKYAGKELKAQGRYRRQYLTPVPDIHLYANDKGNVTPGGSLNHLYILISIAVVTLSIACVNFMNLSTARSAKRAVEIGVRKVLGAEKTALVRQFLMEAMMLALVAFVISLALATLLTPLFQTVSGKLFSFTPRQYFWLLGGFLLISLISGFVSGIYPAFYLSAFKPVKVLKGTFSNSLSAISFRKVLVVFQFVISVALIVVSLTMTNQMSFLRTKDLGFEKDQQIIIPLRTSTARNMYPALKNSLLTNTAISSAGASTYYPGIPNISDWLLYKQGERSDKTKKVYINRVDENYLQTLSIDISAGRLFSKDYPADTNNRIILNEQAVKQFEFDSPAAAIGKNVVAEWGGQKNLFNIVGVVKDFHFKDLHSEIESYGFLLNNYQDYNYFIAHAKGKDIKSALESISLAWTRLNPGEPFEFSFLDDDFQKNYLAEEQLASIIRYFTIIAIFISCLGLFGLTTFSTDQRTKEIGIRKVLGASTAGIISLLSKDFLKLVFISFLIATPIAWYFINNWLQNFAYKAPFSIWIGVLGCATTFLIAFLTISIQAINLALSNPIKNLRTE